MTAGDLGDPQSSRSRLSLSGLRDTLQAARTSGRGDGIHAALMDVMDGLITHADLQHHEIADLRSDLVHKQGIVTNIGGGEFNALPSGGKLREFSASSNGDRWFVGRDEGTGLAVVVHRGNEASGGTVTHVELGAFLSRAGSPPEQVDLLRLIGTLAQ